MNLSVKFFVLVSLPVKSLNSLKYLYIHSRLIILFVGKQFNKFFNKGGFSNVEQDDKINTVGFKLEKIPLTPKLQKLYNEQPGSPAFTNEFESEAIKKLDYLFNYFNFFIKYNIEQLK